MFNQLGAFSAVHGAVLRAHVQSGLVFLDATDVNYAYIAIKLWLLLAEKKAETEEGENISCIAVWNELWTPFESLVNVLETQVISGQTSVRSTIEFYFIN